MVKVRFQRKTTISVLLVVLALSFIWILVSDRIVKQPEPFSVLSSVDIKDFDISLKAVQEYNIPQGNFFTQVNNFFRGKYNSPIYSIQKYNVESKLFLLLLPFIFIVLALSVYNADFKIFLTVVLVYSAFSLLPLLLL